MIKKLFGSETRIVLLREFLLHPESEFYLRQFCTLLGLLPRSVSLELANLEGIGLIIRRPAGKSIFYHANRDHVLFDDLQRIIIKTVGLADVVRKALEPFKADIASAFIYGSFANGGFTAESDVDLMIVGKVSSLLISGAMGVAGQQLGREINFSIFTEEEFIRRLKENDHFMKNVADKSKLFLVGTAYEFERMAEKRLA